MGYRKLNTLFRLRECARMFVCVLIGISLLHFAHADTINYTYLDDQGSYIIFNRLGKLKLSTDVECGLVADGAI